MIYADKNEPYMMANVAANNVGLATSEPVDMTASASVALPSATTIGGSSVVALGAITSTSATAFTVASTSTNYGLQVDESTASAVTGVKIKAGASGTGVAVSTIGGSTNENLKLDAKAGGQVIIGGTSTGSVSLGRGSTRLPLMSTSTGSLGTAQNVTPTAAQLRGGIITQTSATGAGTCTLPTGTLLSGAVTGVTVGDTFECIYANLGGGQTVTITGDTGSTVIGNAAVGSGLNARMTFVNTGTNAWNVYVVVSA